MDAESLHDHGEGREGGGRGGAPTRLYARIGSYSVSRGGLLASLAAACYAQERNVRNRNVNICQRIRKISIVPLEAEISQILRLTFRAYYSIIG